MRGTAQQQYPMMPSTHSFPAVVPPGSVPRQPMMHFPRSSAGLPPNVHPHYAFQQSLYGMPMVRDDAEVSIGVFSPLKFVHCQLLEDTDFKMLGDEFFLLSFLVC